MAHRRWLLALILSTGLAAQSAARESERGRGDETPADIRAVLAAFPADELPILLADLTSFGPQRKAASTALGGLGPRVHPFLLGLLRSPRRSTHVDHLGFDNAFGDLGPADAWLVPGLLEILPDCALRNTVPNVLERLGPTAAPAIVVLEGRDDPAATALAVRLKEAGTHPAAQPYRPRPTLGPAVAPHFSSPLLALLADPERGDLWWQALQALIAIDEAAAAAGMMQLARHALGEPAPVTEHAADLLFAASCYFAAIAPREFAVVTVLPTQLRHREARRFVMSTMMLPERSRMRRSQNTIDDADALIHAELLRYRDVEDPELRALPVLHEALRFLLAPGERDRLRAARSAVDDRDPEVRELARALLRRTRADAAPVFAVAIDSANASQQLAALEQLADAALAELPPARLLEVLALVSPPTRPNADRASPPKDGAALQALLQAARQNERSAGHHYAAQRLLARLVQEAPEAILQADVAGGDADKLVQVALQSRTPSPRLFDWLLDHLGPAPEKRTPQQPLPAGLAPALVARVRQQHELPTTLGWLATMTRYPSWTEPIAGLTQGLEELLPELSPELFGDFALLLTWGEPSRRLLERLTLDPATPGGLRTQLVRVMSRNAERFPPCSAFVLAALDSPFERLRDRAPWHVRHVREGRSAVGARLAELLEDPGKTLTDERLQTLATAAAAIDEVRALPALRARLDHPAPPVRAHIAAAVLGLDADDAAARATLQDLLDGASDDPNRTWDAIARSPTASLVFLDEAVARLGQSDEDGWRLVRIARAAAERDMARARAVLEQLARQGRRRTASAADQTLRELDRRQ